jgi:2,3-bisphosphoglycerate-independent phosphoglycerate mutase
MKKILLILDGMADRKQELLDGKTPIEYANLENLDALFSKSLSGCVQTIPDNEEAGSAVANLNLLGFNTKKVYRGRAVIEAAGADIPIDKDSLYIRCNFITLSGKSFETSKIESYSAHEIETTDSIPLTNKLNEELFGEGFELKNTGSFRNVLVCKDKTHLLGKLDFMPPHDIIGKNISDYMIENEDSKQYIDFMKSAYSVLKENNPTKANAIWFWGVSCAPDFSVQNKDKKVILAETILMKGLANLMGADKIVTSEDNGFKQFLEDKKQNAIKAVKSDYDFLYVHIQAPDDLSHELLPKEKSEALSLIDIHFLKGFLDGIKDEEFSLVVASDHYTFSDDGSHGRQPAPFLLYNSKLDVRNKFNSFSEENCIRSNFNITPSQLHKKL